MPQKDSFRLVHTCAPFVQAVVSASVALRWQGIDPRRAGGDRQQDDGDERECNLGCGKFQVKVGGAETGVKTSGGIGPATPSA